MRIHILANSSTYLLVCRKRSSRTDCIPCSELLEKARFRRCLRIEHLDGVWKSALLGLEHLNAASVKEIVVDLTEDQKE